MLVEKGKCLTAWRTVFHGHGKKLSDKFHVFTKRSVGLAVYETFACRHIREGVEGEKLLATPVPRNSSIHRGSVSFIKRFHAERIPSRFYNIAIDISYRKHAALEQLKAPSELRNLLDDALQRRSPKY